MEKLQPDVDGRSVDIVKQNIEKLKQLFPEVITEGKVDFDALHDVLGDYVDDRQERYRFSWNGKSRARRIAQTASTATLRPCPEESVNWETTKHLFIEGDNLEVLKLLQKAFHRRVKLVCIDPPYNTGKEFIYPDKYQDSLGTYLRYTGQMDDAGFNVSSNAETSGRFHTNWLNMMLPRLTLARNLISEDGFIVVAIDDAELANLERLLDEVFGEENRLAVLVFDRNRKNDAKFFSVGHEYMVVYARNQVLLKELDVRLRAPKEGVDEARARFQQLREETGDDWEAIATRFREFYAALDEDDPRKPLARFNKVDEQGPFRTDGDASWPGGGGPRYEVPHPTTGRPCKVPSRGWVWPRFERMKEEIDRGKIVFGPDESTVPSVRRNLFEKADQVMRSVAFSYAQKAAQEFAEIFDGKKVFDNPKSRHDIQRLVEYLTGTDDIILDFFAGSCTTAESVLSANLRADSDRRFICVQLPQPLDPSKKEHQVGYDFCVSEGLEPNIAEIGKERIRRVSERIRASISEEGRNPVATRDLGFKVFKLDASNIKPWDANHDHREATLFDSVETIKPDRSDADVLYELLLKYGLDLAVAIEQRIVAGSQVFVVGSAALVVCLANDITLDVVHGIAGLQDELKPERMRVVFKAAGFKDDVVKTNAVQILRQRGIDDVKSL